MFIDGKWYTETELAALVISLKADNERVVEANKKISGMYWEQMNKNIEQKKKIEELEEKHWDECRQIAQYDDESKKKNELLRTVGKLLIQIANNELSIEIKDEESEECPLKDSSHEALEKQMPYKPKEYKEYEDKFYACKCGNVLMYKWKTYPTELTPKSKGLPFCLACGQALDWSDEE